MMAFSDMPVRTKWAFGGNNFRTCSKADARVMACGAPTIDRAPAALRLDSRGGRRAPVPIALSTAGLRTRGMLRLIGHVSATVRKFGRACFSRKDSMSAVAVIAPATCASNTARGSSPASTSARFSGFRAGER
jgi:hypothetical protein